MDPGLITFQNFVDLSRFEGRNTAQDRIAFEAASDAQIRTNPTGRAADFERIAGFEGEGGTGFQPAFVGDRGIEGSAEDHTGGGSIGTQGWTAGGNFESRCVGLVADEAIPERPGRTIRRSADRNTQMTG